MKHNYEIWDMCKDMDTPLFLYKKYPEFMPAYADFQQRIKTIPCVIMCNYDLDDIDQDRVEAIRELKRKKKEKVWIYESPDGGVTIYRRPFGEYDKRERII